MLVGQGGAKMADFGFSCVAKQQRGAVNCDMASGTPGYACPNYLATGKVTEGSEVYSFGKVLLELLVNEMASGVMPDGSMRFPIDELIVPQAPNALQRCMQYQDVSAGWPTPVLLEFANLALACVGHEP